MFKVRLFSSIILLVTTLAVVILGGDILFSAVLIISLIGLFELYQVLDVQRTLLGGIGYVFAVLYYIMIRFQATDLTMTLIIVFLLLLMILYVITFPKYKSIQVMLVFFGLFYVAVMLNYIYRVRMLEDGLFIVWMIFIGAWGSDTCAYCVGVLIGKHKIFPKLSPKKSLEGCIGGIVGAALIGYIYGSLFRNHFNAITNPALIFAIIGGASSILSQAGDLAASAIKRNHDIKDYGSLIPGHGGILDRFDSIIFTAPIVYFLATLFLNRM